MIENKVLNLRHDLYSVAPLLEWLLTLLFRGNDVLFQEDPTWKDAALLTTFGRALVAAQTGSSA